MGAGTKATATFFKAIIHIPAAYWKHLRLASTREGGVGVGVGLGGLGVGGMWASSYVTCLSNLIIDHASFSRCKHSFYSQ